jgi:hypothetical protein
VKGELDAAAARQDGSDDPWDVLEESPYAALGRHDGVEYDLDGHVLPKVTEDPWGRGGQASRSGAPDSPA